MSSASSSSSSIIANDTLLLGWLNLKRACINDKIEILKAAFDSPASSPSASSFDINTREPPSSSDSITTQRTLLYYSCSSSVTQLLLDRGADPLVADKYGRTVLHLATQARKKDVMQCLLKHAPQLLHIEDTAGNTPLFDAETIELVQLLLALGSDLSHANHIGDTLLHVAARSGRKELVAELLEQGADATRRNQEGKIPLHFACENGHRDIVVMLLSPSLTPAVDVNTRDNAGWSALHNACLGGYPEHESHTPIVAFLLEKGADVDARDCMDMRPIHVCTDTTALRLLLAAGADADARDADGRSPLHLTSTDNSVVLLELPEVHLHARDKYLRTALHTATDEHKARLLLMKGVNKDALDQNGLTPLDCAIATERPEVIATLREFGAHTSKELLGNDGSKRFALSGTTIGILAAAAVLVSFLIMRIRIR